MYRNAKGKLLNSYSACRLSRSTLVVIAEITLMINFLIFYIHIGAEYWARLALIYSSSKFMLFLKLV